MNIVPWEQFSAVFAAPDDVHALAVRQALIEQHHYLAWAEASSADDYALALVAVYGCPLDGGPGTMDFISWLEGALGDAFTTEPADDDETVELYFADKAIVRSYHYTGNEDFDVVVAQIEQLLGQQYFIVFCSSSGISDTLELLLVPAEYWRRAEALYGKAGVAAQFRRYVSDWQCFAAGDEAAN